MNHLIAHARRRHRRLPHAALSIMVGASVVATVAGCADDETIESDGVLGRITMPAGVSPTGPPATYPPTTGVDGSIVADNSDGAGEGAASLGAPASAPEFDGVVPVSPVPPPTWGQDELLGELVLAEGCAGLVGTTDTAFGLQVLFRLDGSWIDSNQIRYPDGRVIADGSFVAGRGSAVDPETLVDFDVPPTEIDRCERVLIDFTGVEETPGLYLATDLRPDP